MNRKAYNAVRHDPTGGGVALLDRAWIRMTGRDRHSFLNGQVSNDILYLQPGHGVHACVLNNTGHMLANLYVHALPESLLIETDIQRGELVQATLNRYLVREKVEIEDVSHDIQSITVQGNGSRQILEGFIDGELGDQVLMPFANCEVQLRNGLGSTLIHHHRTPASAGYDLLVLRGKAGSLYDELQIAPGATRLDYSTFDVLRIEAGLPKWGAELDESVIPLEANLYSAIHQSKGCYMGQEVIARILSRGHTNRSLVGLRLDKVTHVGTALTSEAGTRRHQEIGRLTSVADSIDLGCIALGYIRNEYAEIGTHLCLGDNNASVTALPFVS